MVSNPKRTMTEKAATSTRTISDTKSPTVRAMMASTTTISNVRPNASTLSSPLFVFCRLVFCRQSRRIDRLDQWGRMTF